MQKETWRGDFCRERENCAEWRLVFWRRKKLWAVWRELERSCGGKNAFKYEVMNQVYLIGNTKSISQTTTEELAKVLANSFQHRTHF